MKLKCEKIDEGNVIISAIYDNKTGQKKVKKISLKEEKKHKQNKNIIESYIIASSKRGFSVYEERILLRTIECFQYQLENKKLNKDFSITPDLYGDVMITLPISSLLSVGDKNYSRIKNAFLSLMNKKVIYSNDKEWEAISLISRAKISKYEHTIKFNLHQEIYEALLNFSKGYRKYELKTAMDLKNVYSMRFYELFSGKHDSITYGIDNLKSIFKLENKYKQVKRFIERVIEPAQKELSIKTQFSFTYEIQYEKNNTNKRKGRKKITGITFTPVYNKKKQYEILSNKNKTIELVKILHKNELEIFLSINFTENELINKHYELLHDINHARKKGKIIITSNIIKYAKKSKNPKNYLLYALKKELKQWKKELIEKKLFHKITTKNKTLENYKKEESSIYSFLKNHLELSGKELNTGMDFIIKNGSEKYLNELINTYKNPDGIINDEKIKIHIKNELNKLNTL